MSRHKNRKYDEDQNFPLENYEDLIAENKTLKEENAKLKKLLGKPEKAEKTKDKLIDIERPKGDCPKCGGVLEKTPYSKLGEEWYFLRCNPCKFRLAGRKA